mmetsp:Transcript_20351/g.43611  ORF Transcript_20351/g.43611 Transcript_20351/m.43611 type:complete len:201 (-) Transcript_20351:152-754(-)
MECMEPSIIIDACSESLSSTPSMRLTISASSSVRLLPKSPSCSFSISTLRLYDVSDMTSDTRLSPWCLLAVIRPYPPSASMKVPTNPSRTMLNTGSIPIHSPLDSSIAISRPPTASRPRLWPTPHRMPSRNDSRRLRCRLSWMFVPHSVASADRWSGPVRTSMIPMRMPVLISSIVDIVVVVAAIIISSNEIPRWAPKVE